MISLVSIERDVRLGKLDDANRAIERLGRKGRWGKCDPVHLANLFWRTGNPTRGIRLLGSRFLEITEAKLSERPAEAAEYAACLIRIGAFIEAEWILSLPEVRKTKFALFYDGLNRMTKWDYAGAERSFKEFVKRPGVTDYFRCVGYSNLAAVLVYLGKNSVAAPILQRLLHDSQVEKNRFLLGYVLEVAAAGRVLSRRYRDAERFLGEAEKKWGHTDEYHRILVDKWRALMHLSKAGQSKYVRDVRIRAEKIHDWETVREIDRYEAIWSKNKDLFLKVYFGSPYSEYRNKLKLDSNIKEIPDRWAVEIGEGNRSSTPVTILCDEALRLKHKMTAQNFALLSILTSDLYRPHRLATLHGWLFPDQHYHPDSVTKKMHQAVRRLNDWAKKAKIPLVVAEVNSTYQITAKGRVMLWLPRPGDEDIRWQPIATRLEKIFGDRPFSTAEALAQFSHSRSTLVRELQSLVVAGTLISSGKGPACRYRFLRVAQAA